VSETPKQTDEAAGSQKTTTGTGRSTPTKLDTSGAGQYPGAQPESSGDDLSELKTGLGHAIKEIHRLDAQVISISKELTESKADVERYRRAAEDDAELLRRAREWVDQLAAQIDIMHTLESIADSVHNLDSTLKSSLSPLTVLDRLASPGTPIKPESIERLKAIQATALRFADESYTVHRAVVASPPPTQANQFW
jgi:phage I-like protein